MPYYASAHDPKHDFNLVQPRCVFRQVDEPDSMTAFRQKGLTARHRLEDSALAFLAQCIRVDLFQSGNVSNQAFAAVRIQVVYHEYPSRCPVDGHRVVNVPGKIFFRARRADRRCNHLPEHHVPIAGQAQRPMAFVFEFDPRGLAGPHRDGLGDSLKGLNAGHLVYRNRVRILPEI